MMCWFFLTTIYFLLLKAFLAFYNNYLLELPESAVFSQSVALRG